MKINTDEISAEEAAENNTWAEKMSKYQPLWEYISSLNEDNTVLSFDKVEAILGFAVDHSFLTYKKELSTFGYGVGKISMKEHTIHFNKV